MKFRKILQLLFITLNLGALPLEAQSLTLPFSVNQSSPSVTFSIDSAGTLSETGPFNSSATFTFSGNPQLVWFPAFAAFRAGEFSGNQTTIGQYSTAMGAYSVASNIGSTAIGFSNVSTGFYSTTLGCVNTATGYAATAVGINNHALGNASVAMGAMTTASANSSFALGNQCSANSFAGTVIGSGNKGRSESGDIPSLTSWVANDPLFEVGNGFAANGPPAFTDAFVIYKNGNAAFPSATSTVTAAQFVTTKASGDIPMYTGN